MRVVSYFRVSTQRQGASGLGLDAQRAAVRAYVQAHHCDVIGEFTEIESGKANDRVELAAAIRLARKMKATLVIAKIDRLARNVHFISGLMESKLDFVACDLPQANRLTLHMMAALAEHEAEMISARTKAALAQAKLRGVKLGGVMHDLNVARAVHVGKAQVRKANVIPIIESIRKAGVTTLKGIAEALNARGVKTARGGEWSATQVMRVVA